MLKRFDFFSRSLVTSDGIALDHRSLSPAQPSHEAFRSEDFSCCAGGGGRLVLGDSRGGVTVMGAMGLKPRRVELIDEPIACVALVSDLLVVVSSSSQLKVYKLPAPDSDDRPIPVFSQAVVIITAWRARGNAPPSVPTCMAITKDFKNLAIGYRDGYALRLSSRKSFKEEHLAQDDTFTWLTTTPAAGPCNGIGFAGDGVNLWVAFEHRLSVFGEAGTETRLDPEEGSCPDCSTVGPDPNFFVVGKKDRIAFYTTETPGSCYSVLGDRARLIRCKDSIVAVSSGEIWKGLGGTTSRQQQNGGKFSEQQHSKHTLQIFDLSNKFIAHEFPLWRDSNDTCEFLAADDDTGCVFVLTKSKRRLWRIQEKPIEVKLDDLLKRNLFPIAAALAKQSGCEPGFVADIYRRYGDHLAEKGSFDDAVSQFVLTIGRLEPSYVIRKFLDAPRVRNLTAYLEALHRYGASSNASTSSSPAGDGLDPRLLSHSNHNNNQQLIPSADHTILLLTCYAKLKEEKKIEHLLESKDVKIDVDAALAVLKETGRVDLALKLARERARDDWYVRTLLELADDSSIEHARTALEFIESKDRVGVFRSHGSRLMNLLPEESLHCVRSWIRRGAASVEDVLDSFADFPDVLESLCREAIAEDESGLSPLVWNTALELVLTRGDVAAASDILMHPRANYDGNFALAAVRRFRFRQGELYLHERAQRWDLLLRCRIDHRDAEDLVLSLAKTKLASDPDAWMDVLRYLSQLPATSQRDSAIKDSLDHVGQNNVLPPLLALKVLSERKDSGINLGVVRRFLLSQVQRATRQTEEDLRELRELREDTERMKREASELINEPKVFNATTCCMTGAPLELPVIHFMSGNSYNLSSLPPPSSFTGDKYEDPKCAQDQNSVVDIRRGLARRRVDVDEEFFSELQTARGGEEGFRLIAEYFGKCLFDEEDEDDRQQ